ncbi:VOC family protein [Streptomyces sp. NPDC005538]|uniref:VOC family protein n=1 Tax=unclassified Streptomyces TaxID=2593676 RepID=UPI0033B52CF4
MTTAVGLTFASVNIESADPAGLADFWGKALGRPVTPGATPGVMTVDAPDSGSGLQMIFHPATEAAKGTGGFRPTLLTDDHDEETERLTGLGAKLVNEAYLPPIRLSVLADPEGNPFNLATWQSE